LTSGTIVGHHHHTARDRKQPVPYSWQTGGPITLAGDKSHGDPLDRFAKSGVDAKSKFLALSLRGEKTEQPETPWEAPKSGDATSPSQVKLFR
jgi:hypothetical protein